MSLKILNEAQVEEILYDDQAVLDAVENIFIEHFEGDVNMVPKIYLDIKSTLNLFGSINNEM